MADQSEDTAAAKQDNAPESSASAPARDYLRPHRRVPGVGVALQRALEATDALFDRLMGSKWNPLYQTGTLTIVSMLSLVVTGLYLFIFYRVGSPYETMREIENQLFFGRWIRAAHRYAADAAVLFTVLHALRMFVQGRTWGARTLAWVTGVGMTGLLLAVGWTGYILVWDVFGLQLALEGARLVDLLPFFPEPIQGQFATKATLGTGFFFINLFLHVAIPLGITFTLWLHVSRTARTTIFPPRAITIAFLVGLVALSIVMPLPLEPEARLDRDPLEFGFDWLFAFWVPLMIGQGPWVTALTWAAGGAVFASIPWWWRPKASERPQVSTVDERHCRGCEQCYLDCPYEAIQMLPRTIGTGSEEVARVTPDLCVSCGICSASCDVLRVGPPGRDGRDQLVSIKGLMNRKAEAKGGVVVFACAQSVRRIQALAGTGVTVVELECAGNLHMDALATALKRGAAGAVVWSCPPRNCQFREGPRWLRERMFHKREAELPESVDRSRLLLVEYGPGEAKEALAEIEAFRARVTGSAAPAALAEPNARPALRVLTAAALFGALGALAATSSWSRSHTDGTVRLAWRQSGGMLEQCRTPSEAENAAMPPHMRRAKVCERRYPDYRVVVRVDGNSALDEVIAAGGARKDRAPQLLYSIPVSPGKHSVSVRVDPVLSPEELAASDQKPLVVDGEVEMEAGAIWMVRPDKTTGLLQLEAPEPLPTTP
ncbi:MAG: hydrogenase iron-sulfur subunit [Deltaproteobacteria bacterium]|nr:hydrogenase iron-sulfur subunit [Deltaproteobacteria bacterium]